MNKVLAQFSAAIAAAGMEPPSQIMADGKIHRFATDGNNSKKTGWYVLHSDGVVAGVFGDWRTGLKQRWSHKNVLLMSNAERYMQRARARAVEFQRNAETAARQRIAAAKALRRWTFAAACKKHDYLERKGIKPHGVRVEAGKLLIPLRDSEGTLHSLQTIAPDGTKFFMLDGRSKGCYFGIGRIDGVLIVCEGFATGASIHQSTGQAVAVAFTANNLVAVAVALRNKYSELKIVIAADDDYLRAGNPGLTYAKEAARKAKGTVAVPIFKESTK